MADQGDGRPFRRLRPVLELDEVVMLGRHPTRDLDVLVLEATGSDATWQAALELVDLYLARPEAQFATPPGAVVVYWGRDQIRTVHHLRRIREERP